MRRKDDIYFCFERCFEKGVVTQCQVQVRVMKYGMCFEFQKMQLKIAYFLFQKMHYNHGICEMIWNWWDLDGALKNWIDFETFWSMENWSWMLWRIWMKFDLNWIKLICMKIDLNWNWFEMIEIELDWKELKIDFCANICRKLDSLSEYEK